MGPWETWAGEEADRIRAGGRWRTVRDLDGPGPAATLVPPGAADEGGGGQAVVSFASNDYLGLSHHPLVLAAAHRALDRWGAGAGSARLVAGARPVHRRLEAELAAWTGSGQAVLFATGYAANVGVLQTLGGPGVTIVSDRLNHASIVDGCRLSRADVVVTPHADVTAVERAVAAAAGRVVVVTESVFSMDGDLAPLDELAAVCDHHQALLVVDDAHAVLESGGSTLAGPVLRVGTLSKAVGALGGFVAGPGWLCELVVNRARTFVFTTASTPADAAAGLAAVEIIRSPEGEALRSQLRSNVERLRPGHPSPIVPVVLGDERVTLAVSDALLERGLLVPAIRPPTVPAGSARLRISLSAAHTVEQVDRLSDALEDLVPGRARPTRRPSSARRVAAPHRPRRVVLVLGTGTEIGKTWVAAALARTAREHGARVAARKPVQSFEPAGAPGAGHGTTSPAAPAGPTDADVLAGATGEDPSEVCPPHRWYGVALAPPVAAEVLGRPAFTLSDLLGELVWPPEAEIGLVEGVGGPRSPLAANADGVDLCRALRPDAVVLVAAPGLGAINAVLLSAGALPHPPFVYLNRYRRDDPTHAGNRVWLESRAGLRVTTTISELAHSLGLRTGAPDRAGGSAPSTPPA